MCHFKKNHGAVSLILVTSNNKSFQNKTQAKMNKTEFMYVSCIMYVMYFICLNL